MAVTELTRNRSSRTWRRAFKAADSAILVDYRGLDVPAVTELRRQLRAARAQYKVVKNTIARRASKGTSFESLESISSARPRSPTPATTRWRWPRR